MSLTMTNNERLSEIRTKEDAFKLLDGKVCACCLIPLNDENKTPIGSCNGMYEYNARPCKKCNDYIGWWLEKCENEGLSEEEKYNNPVDKAFDKNWKVVMKYEYEYNHDEEATCCGCGIVIKNDEDDFGNNATIGETCCKECYVKETKRRKEVGE